MKNVKMVTISRSLSQAVNLLCASMTLQCTSHNLDYIQLQTSLCWINKWPFNRTVSSGKLEEAQDVMIMHFVPAEHQCPEASPIWATMGNTKSLWAHGPQTLEFLTKVCNQSKYCQDRNTSYSVRYRYLRAFCFSNHQGLYSMQELSSLDIMAQVWYQDGIDYLR